MLSQNDKISIRQFQILLIIDILGTGIIVAPRRVTELAMQDGWIVIIISTIMAMFLTFMMSTLPKMFDGQSFTAYTSKLLSKPIGVLLSLGFILKLVCNTAIEVRILSEIVKNDLLYETPIWIIVFGMLVVSAYAASKGIETRGRIAEIIIIIILIPIIVIFAISSTGVDFSNIKPIAVTNTQTLLKGGVHNLISFTGIEFCLLLSPYIANTKHMRKASILSVLITGAIMVLITILAIAQFGYLGIKNYTFPTIELMDTITLPGSFIEKQEGLMMSFLIVSIFAIVNAGLFYSATIGKECFKKGEHVIYIIIASALVFVISLIPKNLDEVLMYQEKLFLIFTPIYTFYVPLLLILVANVKKNVLKNITTVVALIFMSSLTTGCFDRVDLEDRRFILAIGIDKTEDGEISLTTSMANNKAFSGNAGDLSEEIVKNVTGNSITLAFEELEKLSGDEIYLGHTRILVFAESILKDNEMLLEILEYFNDENRNKIAGNLSRKSIVLSSEKTAEEILNSDMQDESVLHIYVSEYYNIHNKNDLLGYRMDLGELTGDLIESNNAVIPKIDVFENGTKIEGACLVKKGVLETFLTEEELLGYLFVKENAVNMILDEEELKKPIKIAKLKTDFEFHEKGNELICEINLNVIGEGNNVDSNEEYVNVISKHINTTNYVFQNEYNVDGYGLLQELRKSNYELYLKYENKWEEEFTAIKITTNISFEIHEVY